MGLNLAEDRRIQAIERQLHDLRKQVNDQAARILTLENVIAQAMQEEQDEEQEHDLDGNVIEKRKVDANDYSGLG